MDKGMTTQQARREWECFADSVAPGANDSIVLGLWEIRPNRVKDGWWTIREHAPGGSWGTNLPFPVAKMLWACIEEHFIANGEQALTVLPDEPFAMTRLRAS